MHSKPLSKAELLHGACFNSTISIGDDLMMTHAKHGLVEYDVGMTAERLGYPWNYTVPSGWHDYFLSIRLAG